VALDAPFRWMQQVASEVGGTRNGMVFHWPDGFEARNAIRTPFAHVIDVAPTLLEAASLPEPRSVNGTPQIPMEGTSLVYSFEGADAPERHSTQYFEIAGSRAIYHEGWFARTIHRAPRESKGRHPLADDEWELYNTREDFSLANNLADKQSGKLTELQALYMSEAKKYHVLPIDDRVFERTLASQVGRPDLMQGRTTLSLAEGMTGMSENVFLNVKNQSLTISANITLPESGANGAILVQGGRFGGWALYVKDGVPAYEYNFLGLQRSSISADRPLKPGKAALRFEFGYDGGGLGKGGQARLFVDDQQVASGRYERDLH